METKTIRDAVNLAIAALVDADLWPDGLPEGYLCVFLDTAGLRPPSDVIAILIAAGILDRRDGPIVVRGPRWDLAASALAGLRVAAGVGR